MAKTRITYILPNVESGGTERHVLSLARGLDPDRFSLSVVTTAGGGALYRDFSALLPVTVFGDPFRSRRFRTGPLEHVLILGGVTRILRREKPDIVHSYLPVANVIGPVAARLAGVRRVIVSKRALADYKAKFPILRRVEPFGNRLADVILVNSRAVRQDVERTERHFDGKFRMIYNGVAPIAAWSKGEVEAFRAREGVPPRAKVVLAVSNFYPCKGHKELVDAAARLVPIAPDAIFLLVGRDSGTLRETEEQVGRLGLSGRVRFAGSRDDVPDLIRASDLFVHPSHEEGFSNAILEAMAGGLPVVACNVGGNPEAVESGRTGLLVPPRDPEELAAAIAGLLADQERRARMGEEGRRRALERFALERMVRDFDGLYASLMRDGE